MKLNREEELSKIIDELLVGFDLYNKDYSIIDKALNAVIHTAKNNPSYPITVSLYNHLEKKGLLNENIKRRIS